MPSMYLCQQVHNVEAMRWNIVWVLAVLGVPVQVGATFQGAPWRLACQHGQTQCFVVNKHSFKSFYRVNVLNTKIFQYMPV